MSLRDYEKLLEDALNNITYDMERIITARRQLTGEDSRATVIGTLLAGLEMAGMPRGIIAGGIAEYRAAIANGKPILYDASGGRVERK